jgi:putative ABC transport system substrate-binding protein
MPGIRRREFITLLGGSGAAWPIAGGAQQHANPVIGVLDPGAAEPSASLMGAFRKGLGEAGYFEGQNLTIEYRWANSDVARLPELAADLVRRGVAAIVVPNGSSAALAAKAATVTIPIVFGSGVDPVELGLVASFNRPGGNITGINSMQGELFAKRLGLLHESVPNAERFAALVQPNEPSTKATVAEVQRAAVVLGRPIEIIYANSASEIDAAFENIARMRIEAVVLNPSASLLFLNRRAQFATIAVRYAVPVMYPSRSYVEAGGLMSYGSNITEQYRLVGVYTGRVLKGEKPADLPVQRAAKFEFVINQQTAKIQGFTIPPTSLALVDEVIE